MPPNDPALAMWAEACGLLDRAERLNRQFFQPRATRQPSWEPPVDILETETELWILVALPGVAPEQAGVTIDGGSLIVTGERPMPATNHAGVIRRLEIPYGRFERRIDLPRGRFEIARRDLTHGCLVLGLRKL